jgi:hypothetical protein
MGAPLFLAYLLYSFHSRILPNWIAPSLVPLFCLMVIYWDTRWRLGVTKIKGWLVAGLCMGYALVIMGHEPDLWKVSLSVRRHLPALAPASSTNLIAQLAMPYLPLKLDPLHRVRAWDGVARTVGEARQDLLTEGKPVFIIAEHYGLAGTISFYLPEAKESVRGEPLVYCQSTEKPENQFYFWPGYDGRKGQNAIFVNELDRDNAQPEFPPARLLKEFESVTDLGVREVLYHDQVCRALQLFACRGLR